MIANLISLEEKARTAIGAWRMYHHQGYEIPVYLRNMLRWVPSFVPECGSICQELTTHILTTDNGWTRCLHHSYNKKSQNDINYNTREWSLTGTPYESSKSNSISHGILSCGCELENALLDFYLFKTGQLWSPTKSQWEDWKSQRMHPRIRELVMRQVKLETFWGVENIWCYKANEKGEVTVLIPESERFSIMHQHQAKKLEEIREKEKQAAVQAAADDEEYNRKTQQELQAVIEEGKRDAEERVREGGSKKKEGGKGKKKAEPHVVKSSSKKVMRQEE